MANPYIPIAQPLHEKLLKPPLLNALIPDGEVYRTILYQHQGEIEFSDQDDDRFVRNRDRALATKQFSAFFATVRTEGADLVVAPEYSCPWDVVDNLISAGHWPVAGKVWIIGCESIRADELRNFRTKHADSVVLIADSTIESNTPEKFLDPVCIFFRTEDENNGVEKDVLLIQFKTASMGGEFETLSLLRGEKRYVLHNRDADSVRLAVITCSESATLELNPETLPEFGNNSPYLLVHIQLNPKSKQTEFKKYRTDYFSKGKEHLCFKELICLNWANGTQLPNTNGQMMPLKSGGTSIYSKWHEMDTSDARIIANDQSGLFYNNWSDAYTSLFNFVPIPGLFLFESYKCSQHCAMGASPPRSGPRMIRYFEWNEDVWDVNAQPELGLKHKIAELLGSDFEEEVFASFFDNSLKYLEIERLMLITNGQINLPQKTSQTWELAPNLRSIHIKPDEYSRRFTYLYDSDNDSAVWKFNNYFGFIKAAVLVRTQPETVFNDPRFNDFVNGSKLCYSPTAHNLESADGKKAILAFIGNGNRAKACLALETITSATNESELVVVLYNNVENDILPEFSPIPSTGENTSKGSASISRRG